jgi:group I intron endonuclease
MGFIYRIQNKVTGKSYIGQTSVDLYERWRKHSSKNSNCVYLRRALELYGKESFKFQLICVCFDKDLNKFEREYIKKYNTIVPNGYNLSSGGDSGNKHHEETKRKISESIKKIMNEPGFVHNKPSLGIPHSQEVKEKISNSLKGRKQTENHVTSRSNTRTLYGVIKSSNGIDIERYGSTREASEKTGISKIGIWYVCREQRKHAGGFQWRFFDIEA